MTAISGTEGVSGQGSLVSNSNIVKETEDRFLTLLVTQMRNQDPLNPMDNAQVTSQMAQLSTVTGINQLNETLLALSGQMDVSQSIQAANLIGKQVLVPGSKVALGGEGDAREATPFGVDLVSPADSVIVTVVDSSGAPVRKIDMGPKAAGVYTLEWDGLSDSGAPLPSAAYRVEVAATNEDGSSVPAEALTSGTVSSVAYSSAGLQMELGLAGSYSLLDLRKIL
ncbi:flagellar hook capping FlgD N-terminal domain-containing protein [Allopusillimonas ginsengisoli]|uniref:flagellar hook capping FlgD N-terminal domain-containing protein n=1 Tax=Allopusillimonas ginsengisoli TaxID=453575 RepID=UPI0039C3674D